MTDSGNYLLEPYDAYNNLYRNKFTENANALFDRLVNESNIDVEENRKTAAKYREYYKKTADLKSKLSRYKALRTFLIILTIIGLAGLCIGIYLGNAAIIAVSPTVSVGAAVIIFALLNGKIAGANAEYADSSSKTNQLKEKAVSIVSPLIDLFEESMTNTLITETVPEIKFDGYFGNERLDCLVGKYAYDDFCSDEASTVGIQSGELTGSPFLIEKQIKHRMGNQVYTGSKIIHWTTTTYENGKRVTVNHTQTLTASVTKPKPFYDYSTDLSFFNDAAPDLCFSRTPTHAERMSEKQLKRFISSKTKEIRKLTKEKITAGFTELGNEEFDTLFGALNRNHEVQFRLLFTPLAQSNLLKIIKSKSPFGDDFHLTKSKRITTVCSEHLQSFPFNISPDAYASYDVDIIRSAFLKLNAEYFESLYFDLCPILSVPLYQQTKPSDSEFSKTHDRVIPQKQAEEIVNRIGYSAFAHELTVTPAILKTELSESSNGVDTLEVSAFSYKTVPKVDYVPVMGGDGRWHDVAIPWLLYVPLKKKTRIMLSLLSLSEREYRNSEYNSEKAIHTYYRSVYATLGSVVSAVDDSPNEADDDISDIEDTFEDDLDE